MPEPLSLFLHTGRLIAGAPLRSRRWTARQWAWRAAFASVVALAYYEKRPLQALIQGNGGPTARAVAEFINDNASGVGMTGLILGSYAVGALFRKKPIKQTSVVLCVGAIWAALLWSAGRLILAEHRPVYGGDMHFFALDGHGFSGHEAVAAVILLPVRSVLLRHSPRLTRSALTATIVGWMALVGWSRVFLGMHFGWNILSGLAVGLWAGAAAVEAYQEFPERKAALARDITPTAR